MVNLNELEQKLDAALENETPESLSEFIMEKRAKKTCEYIENNYSGIEILPQKKTFSIKIRIKSVNYGYKL